MPVTVGQMFRPRRARLSKLLRPVHKLPHGEEVKPDQLGSPNFKGELLIDQGFIRPAANAPGIFSLLPLGLR